MKIEIELTNPIAKWTNKRKIVLTREQAMIISAMLENHRKDMIPESQYEANKILESENVLDAKLFGKIKLNNEWVKI